MNFDEVVLKERQRLQERRQALLSQSASIQEELMELDRRLGHIHALLREDMDAPSPGSAAPEVSVEVSPGPEPADPAELAFSVLEQRGGEPMHYRELARLVLERGADLAGADPAQTLVSRLVRDERFVRPFRRGWYALRMHFPRARSVGKRKKTTRSEGEKQRVAKARRRTS